MGNRLGPHASAEQTVLRLSGLDHVPGLGALFDEFISARQRGAAEANITYDRRYGHPVAIDIDWEVNAVDDESCYVIRSSDIVQ